MDKALERIRNEVAKDNGFKDWNHLIYAWAGLYDEIQPFEDEVAKRYAIEAVKADRERVAKFAKIDNSCTIWNCEGNSVDKESVLDLPIELP